MKAGLPIITSLSEVCGDAALYANPYSIKEIKTRVLWLNIDSDKYAELIEKGYQQFKKINTRQINDLTLLADSKLSNSN